MAVVLFSLLLLLLLMVRKFINGAAALNAPLITCHVVQCVYYGYLTFPSGTACEINTCVSIHISFPSHCALTSRCKHNEAKR